MGLQRIATRKGLLGVLCVVVLLAAACGGSEKQTGPSTPDQYFAALEQAANDYDATTNQLHAAYSAAMETASQAFQTATADADASVVESETQKMLATTVDEVTKLFEGARVALGTFVDALKALSPPDAVKAAHQEAVDTLVRSRDSIPDLISALDSAASIHDVDAVITGSDWGDTQPRVAAACNGLEAVAAGFDITVDLHCPSAASG